MNVAYVPVPTLTPSEFLEFVLLQFGLLNLAHANKAERLVMLERFLRNAHDNRRTVVLVVDEAHKLNKELLEEIRLLSNFNTRRGTLTQIVLAGQSELDDVLRQSDMCQFKQRVAYRFCLKGLDEAELRSYIRHRWSRAGGTSSPPFDEGALRAVTLHSRGIPRLINALCDNALVMCFADNAHSVRASTVHEAACDLDLVGGEHRLPLGDSPNGDAGTAELELLALASTATSDGRIPELERQVATPKESWLVRSTRKLLSEKRPVETNEQDL